MVGYQGLSSRSSSQRQSGENGTGPVALPIAPARCATGCRPRSTRSSIATTAAVSAKSSNCWPSLNIAWCSNSAPCRRAHVLLQADEIDSGDAKQPGEAFERNRAMAVVPKTGIACPAHPDTRPSVVRQARPPSSDAVRKRPQIRNVGRHCFEARYQIPAAGSSADNTDRNRAALAARHHERNAGHGCHQRFERARHRKDDFGAA